MNAGSYGGNRGHLARGRQTWCADRETENESKITGEIFVLEAAISIKKDEEQKRRLSRNNLKRGRAEEEGRGVCGEFLTDRRSNCA